MTTAGRTSEAGAVLHEGSPDLGADLFRRLWRGVGSTVTVIATEHDRVRHAMLATAVTSVSMDPPSLLVCVNRSASSHEALVRRGAFSLGVIGWRSQELAAAIAKVAGVERFSYGSWGWLPAGEATAGLPFLKEAQTTLGCVTEAQFDYGTHTMLVGRVVNAWGEDEPDPLLYCSGRYGRFDRPLT